MEEEKLIEFVRKYEFIYNLKHPKYMDNVKKQIAWKEIGEQLKQSPVACKQRWQCLRDAYRRALNKKKGKSKQAAKNIKQWKYEKEMAFVAPFLITRKTQDSIEITSDDELSDNADEIHEIESNASENPNTDTEIDDTLANVSDANSTKISNEPPQNESQQIIYTKNSKAELAASAILMAKLLDDQNKLEPPRGYDELDRFFLNISDTVKKFSSYEQALAKNKIFSLVSEMELQLLAPSSSSPYAFNPSPESASSSVKPMPTSPENWNDETQHFFYKFNTPK
nr:transcription factor Adf-1-like [Vanessa tameamea]